MALGMFHSLWQTLLYGVPSKGLLRRINPSNCMSYLGAKRHLLSEDVVKLQGFQQRKLAVAHQVAGSKGKYFEAFNQKLQKNELILKDELKMLLHMCQSSEDMVTARGAIYRYHEENHNVSFGEFKFGPLFMRLCYELGHEEMAAATLTDKSLRGFFSDSTSFNIAIDMLFLKGCYSSALEVVIDMKNQGVGFNKDTFTLAAGTCYKLNTPESYQMCCALMEEGQTKGNLIPRHAYCFAVALALKQNDVEKAKSMFSHIMTTDSRLCQNLKVLILAMSGSVWEALFILTSSLVSTSPSFVKKMEFSQEVVEVLLWRSENSAHLASVEQMVSRLQQAGQVVQRSLDEMLCHTPTGKKKPAWLTVERRLSRRTGRPLQSSLLSE
ncbi:pentatricopeptide repeat-containing protein 2, mitochondrial [Osmerus mordax]|uniref:pentatricopeptide repeat-containing protein 2, mitochondrial n=1 Tax=Osmerus mordax TaxID=8014 RepID=UPI00350F295B